VSPKHAALATLLLATTAAVYAYRRAGQGIDAAALPEEAPSNPTWWTDAADTLDTYTSIDYWIDTNQAETEKKVSDMTAIIDTDANVRAFLESIARAEGTAGQADPYRVCYAYRWTIKSFADHPAITGEWKGEKLSDAMCAGAGLGPGCVSTAAGKYQITKGTWFTLKKRLGLKDFAPASQDAAAIELLRETGALYAAQTGDLATAVAKSRRTWASLPGAGYAQPERSFAWLQNQFTSAGGVLA
jgi:muramidase (phage lysozyme)